MRPPRFNWRRLTVVVVLLAGWEIAVKLTGVSPILVPPLEGVLRALFTGIADMTIIQSTWATVENLLVAMALGLAIAVALNMLAFVSTWGRELLQTLAAALNPLPAIALLPLAFLWFGASDTSLLFVLVNSIVWAMALNIFTGFATVPPTLQAVGRIMGLRGVRLFSHVYVPAALPYIYTGIKISWAFGWRTVIAAELVFGATASATGGLGWRIFVDRFNLDTDGTFAALLVIVVIGLAVEAGFQQIEKRTVQRWGMARA